MNVCTRPTTSRRGGTTIAHRLHRCLPTPLTPIFATDSARTKTNCPHTPTYTMTSFASIAPMRTTIAPSTKLKNTSRLPLETSQIIGHSPATSIHQLRQTLVTLSITISTTTDTNVGTADYLKAITASTSRTVALTSSTCTQATLIAYDSIPHLSLPLLSRRGNRPLQPMDQRSRLRLQPTPIKSRRQLPTVPTPVAPLPLPSLIARPTTYQNPPPSKSPKTNPSSDDSNDPDYPRKEALTKTFVQDIHTSPRMKPTRTEFGIRDIIPGPRWHILLGIIYLLSNWQKL